MPVCVKVVGLSNALSPVNPIKDADGRIVGSSGITDYSTQCEMVVLTGPDYHLLGGGSAWHQLGNLSIDNAHVIGLAVGACWAIAFTFRLLAKAVIDPPQNGTSES